MNHMKKNALALIVAIVLCIGLAACGTDDQKKGGNTAIVGTWQLTEIAAGSSKISAEDYLKSANVDKGPVLTFEDSGKVTLDVDGDSGSGTWTEEGGAYSITYQSGDQEVTEAVAMNGSTLKMEQNGYTLTYEKK